MKFNIYGNKVKFSSFEEFKMNSKKSEDINYLSNEVLRGDDIFQILKSVDTPTRISFINNSMEIFDSKERIYQLLDIDANIYKYLADRYKNNVDVILYAMKSKDGGKMFEFIPDNYKRSKDIVIEAVKTYEMVLEIAPVEFKYNKEMLLEVSKINPSIVFFMSNQMKNDKDIALSILESTQDNYYSLFSDKLKNDKDVMLKALKNDKDVFRHIDPEMKKEYGDNINDFIRKLEGEVSNDLSVEGTYRKLYSKYNTNNIVEMEEETERDLVLFQYYVMKSQVENGGFSQYFTNGYASKYTSGAFDIHSDKWRHEFLMNGLKKHFYSLSDNLVFKDMMSVLEEFNDAEIDLEEYSYEEDEEGDEVEVNNSNYGNIMLPRGINTRFYKLDSKFTKLIENSPYRPERHFKAEIEDIENIEEMIQQSKNKNFDEVYSLWLKDDKDLINSFIKGYPFELSFGDINFEEMEEKLGEVEFKKEIDTFIKSLEGVKDVVKYLCDNDIKMPFNIEKFLIFQKELEKTLEEKKRNRKSRSLVQDNPEGNEIIDNINQSKEVVNPHTAKKSKYDRE